MAYKCPRCGNPVQRGYSPTAQVAAAIVGALFYSAFGAFQCKTCGKLKRAEFSTEDQSKMLFRSAALIVAGIAIATLALLLRASMNSTVSLDLNVN